MAATMLALCLPIAAAVVPALLLLWYFHSRDVYPEPPRVVWATFFLGVLTIPGILLVAYPAGDLLVGISNPYWFGLGEAFVCAAIPEEFFKFLVLTRYAARHKEFNEPMDGIVYGVAASLGFAALENILYIGSGGMGVAFLRAFTAVPGHAFTGVVMGYFVGRARFASQARATLFWLGLLAPVVLHGLYDFPLLTLKYFQKLHPDAEVPGELALLALLTLIILILEWRLALRCVRVLRALQDNDRRPPDAAPAPAPPSRPPSSLLAWVQLVLGGLLSTGGGLLVMLLIAGLAIDPDQKDMDKLVIGGAIIGVLPLVLGIFLFRAGVRRQNRAATHAKVAEGSGLP